MEKEMKVPDYTLYCVKKTFFPEELKSFKTIEEAKEYYDDVTKANKRVLYTLYVLNFYRELLDRKNVMEIIYSEDNITIASSLKEGYELYLSKENKDGVEELWEYDSSFHYLDSDYEVLSSLGLIENNNIRKRCK